MGKINDEILVFSSQTAIISLDYEFIHSLFLYLTSKFPWKNEQHFKTLVDEFQRNYKGKFFSEKE